MQPSAIWSRFTAILLTVCWSLTRLWGQYNRIAEAIQSLNILPERCALVESEPERTQGLRQMLVDNYSVFYIVGENTVSVARVLYSASDFVRRLRRMK